jgi:hypothetical protein
MRKFKIIKMNGQYVIQKRNFFYQYKVYKYNFYDTSNAAITEINKEYYADECEIEIIDYTNITFKKIGLNKLKNMKLFA